MMRLGIFDEVSWCFTVCGEGDDRVGVARSLVLLAMVSVTCNLEERLRVLPATLGAMDQHLMKLQVVGLVGGILRSH